MTVLLPSLPAMAAGWFLVCDLVVVMMMSFREVSLFLLSLMS